MESPTPCTRALNGRAVPTAIPRSWTRTFPATTDQARETRRFLIGVLDGSPLADDAAACLAELVGNSLIHSDSRLPGGSFTVRVRTRPGWLRVEVRDNGGPWSPRPHSAGAEGSGPDLSGRGLVIVDALAGRWDITPKTTAPSRLAWFEMSHP